MSIGTPSEIDYPSGNGKPMAETQLHIQAIVLLLQALQDFFAVRPDVYVAADSYWYWEKGNGNRRVAPDVMVVPGVRPRPLAERRSFRSWEEGGAVPAVVFEVASEKTWETDVGRKRHRYSKLRVPEYFLFDPEAKYLSSPLIGYRRGPTRYRRMPLVGGELASDLGFRLRAEGGLCRLIDASTGLPVPTRGEAVEVQKARADAEKARADALAAELDRLRRAAGGGGP